MMTNEQAIELLHRISDSQFDGKYGDERREALEMAVRALEGDGDTISRKQAIDAIEEMQMPIMRSGSPIDQSVFTGMGRALQAIKDLPSAQPEYKPVTAEDFAKMMSENTLYGFMAWHGEAITLMNEMGFVICKKTM